MISDGKLNDLDLATNPALAVDRLRPFFVPHAGAEADFAGAVLLC